MTNRNALALTPDQTPSTNFKVEGSGEVLMALRSDCFWFDAAIRRLQEVANLEENWDSYGACAVNEVSVHFGHCFLSHLKEYVGIEQPAITATPDGHVAFIWEDSNRSLEVEIDDRGVASYVYERAQPPVDDTGETVDYSNLIEMLTRV